MKTHVLIFFVTLVSAFSEDCNNTCYDGIQDRIQRLIDVYSNPPNITKIPMQYNKIHKLIKEFEKIPKHKTNITSIPEKIKETNETLLEQKEVIKNIEDNIPFLDELIKDLNDMDNKTIFHNITIDTCDDANKKFEKLRNDVNNIEEIGRKLNESYYKNLDNINRINKDSSRIKKMLDDIMVPDLTSTYICNSDLEKKIRDILKTANNLKNLLANIKGHILDKLRKNIENNNKIIDDILSLNKSLPELPLSYNNETKPLIQKLREQLEDLKNNLKNKTLNENILDEIKTSNDDFLKELEKILMTLFSKENKEKVKAEIKDARDIIKLIKDRNKMKITLEDFEKIVRQLLKGEVCLVEEDIDLEPSVEGSG